MAVFVFFGVLNRSYLWKKDLIEVVQHATCWLLHEQPRVFFFHVLLRKKELRMAHLLFMQNLGWSSSYVRANEQ